MAKQKPNILLVDDEHDILELLTLTLARMDLTSEQACDVASARRLLSKSKFDLCLTDLRLPDGTGLDIVNYIQKHHPGLPVAVISAHGNMQTAIEAMKAGSFDFVSKPIDLEQLRNMIKGALKLGKATAQDGIYVVPELIGRSDVLHSVKNQVLKLARSMAPVHIKGESGTGKELVARMIHKYGPRKDKPFIAVNCSAIPSELMESEFFGHKKGSFTGAVSDKPGLFQAANGGTLMLDEIAEMPLAMQAKLLRVIQERSVRPVGAHDEISINTRILSATHKDLLSLVKNNKFREDLYYRINVIDLFVPPLRERKEDLPELVDYISNKIAERNYTPHPRINDSALQKLQKYSFPGNIRELENILERSAALCETDVMTSDDIQLPDDPVMPDSQLNRGHGEDLDEYLERIERNHIESVLHECHYNKTRAAEKLGISFRSLRYKVKKLGIETDSG